jgi:chromatin assembly factor 1 subunit B
MLPGITTHANCIRFCPYLTKLKELTSEDPTPMINLPYRMTFAIGTIDHVIIYSTQSIYPIAVVKNLHYDTINDLAWMHTNLLLVASSDGFCSFI